MARRLGDDEAAARWEGWFERGQVAFDRRLWRGDHYAYDGGGGPSSDSVMADQLAGQWYADATGLGDLMPPDQVATALRTIHRAATCARSPTGGWARSTACGPTARSTTRASSRPRSGSGTTYALAAFMLGRGLDAEGWETARGVVATTYERGLWFRTPEAYDRDGNFRATIYLRPLAIWAIEEALRRRAGGRPGTTPPA